MCDKTIRLVLVAGGTASGQEAWALEHFPKARILRDYHLRIREQMDAGQDPMEEARALTEENRIPLVILTDETGCGVVPVDPRERALREMTGRVHCFLASRADLVVHTVCGIGEVIKDVRREG